MSFKSSKEFLWFFFMKSMSSGQPNISKFSDIFILFKDFVTAHKISDSFVSLM